MIHFIWLGPSELCYADYLAVKTAYKVYGIRSILWTDNTVPNNEYLEKMLEFVVQRPLHKDWQRITALGKAQSASQSSNYLRYCVLHDYGGVYLDMDTLSIKPITEFNTPGLLVGHEPVRGGRPHILNGAVMGVKGIENPAIAAMLEESVQLIEDSQGVLKWGTTGPRLVTKILETGKYIYTALPTEYFHIHSHWEWSKMFEDNPIDERMYVLHHWGKYSRELGPVNDITPEYIRESSSLYAKVVRQVLGPGDL